MSWKIERPAGCSRLVYIADSDSKLIGYQWDQLLRSNRPGFHPLGLIRSRDGAFRLVADFSCTCALSEIDDVQDRTPAKGVERLRQTVEVLQYAADCLFDERQAILDSETVRYPITQTDSKSSALLVILPCIDETAMPDKPAASLIVQIASAYGWSAQYTEAVATVYDQSGLKALNQFLTDHPDGETIPAYTESKPVEHSLSKKTRDSNLLPEEEPQKPDGKPVRFGKHSAFAVWIGLHVLLAAAAFLHRPLIAVNRSLDLIIQRSLPIPILLGLAGVIVLLLDIRLIRKMNQSIRMKSRPTQRAMFRLPLKKRPPNGKRVNRFYEGSLTERVEKREGSFRMAMLSEHLPGTPEELEGIRAFLLLDEFLIGREETEVDLWLSDATVGRKHARITRREGSFFLTDLGSKNGTCLNGRRLNRQEETLLPDRCRIQFADQAFYFQADG